MEIRKAKLVYFSPTGTAKKVVTGIALGLGVENAGQFDLTIPAPVWSRWINPS